jgi:hypothetical protein
MERLCNDADGTTPKYLEKITSSHFKGKGKGKFCPRTGRNGPEGE